MVMNVEPEATVSLDLWPALEDSLRSQGGALGLGSPEQ